jgi:molybdopterin-guanine dinucleotide biosynthesis protein
MTHAYQHLNLRYNPFGELDRDARVELTQGRLEVAAGEVVQIVGASGRGKTTQLLALHRHLRGSVYEVVPLGSTRVKHTSPPREGLLLDEAQRVSPRRLRKLISRAHTLVLGTHDDLSHLSRRSMRTVNIRGLPREKLDAILAARVEAARRGPGVLPRIPATQQQILIDRFGDDLRAIESLLYDVFQALTGAEAPIIVPHAQTL